jgi:uncharacterized membrane protein YbhN (UPF0104 family)
MSGSRGEWSRPRSTSLPPAEHDLSGRLVQGWRGFWGWAERHPRLHRVLRFLRRHWLEAIAVVSLTGLIIAVDPAKLAAIYGRLDIRFLLLMLPVTIGVYAARGAGFWVALRHLGVRISLGRAVAIMFAGQALIFMPAGDLARVALVRRTTDTDRDDGTLAGSIAFQELLFLTLLGLGVLPRVLTRPDVALLVLLMTAAHAGVFVILLWEPAYDRAVRTVERFRLLRRFDDQLRSLRPAFLAMLRPGNLIGVTLCNAAAVVLLFLLFALALQAVGVHKVGILDSAFVYGLAHILGGLSFLPSGMGSMEAIMVVLLASQGVPPAAGAAAAVLQRAFNDLLMAVLGLGVGLLLRRWQNPSRR